MTKHPVIKRSTRERLLRYAATYETTDFLRGDPSWFMHQVSGPENQEAMAFVASCLSYGSRQQFMQKIEAIRIASEGEMHAWVREGAFATMFRQGDTSCFYRLFNCDTMYRFLEAYRQLLLRHGTLGCYVRGEATDGLGAVEAICRYFAAHDISVIIPKNTLSACKRVCMFLRWMVRDNSPVDLGLWADFIDRRTLIIPLDTHVLQQARNLSLLTSSSASMHSAQRLTAILATLFPDDPLRGDFALFGHGINVAHPTN